METEEVPLPTTSLGPSSAFTTVPVTIPTRSTSSRPRAHRRPWPRWRVALAYGAGSLLLVAAVVASVLSHNTLQRTDASIAAMHAQWQRTTGQIARARTRMAQARQEAGAAAASLAAASDELGKVQAELASMQSNIDVDGVSIANLDACLSGVNQALNEVSLGDQTDASALLDQYAGDCQAAEPSG